MTTAEVLRRVAATNPAYRRLAAAANLVPTAETAIPLPCIHEGRPVPPSPGQSVTASYLVCEAGKGVVCRCACNFQCDRYDDGEPKPEPPPSRRHLVCHLLPTAGTGVWQRTIDHLRLRWPLFTGRKLFAVSTGSAKLPLDPPTQVRDYLPADAEVIEVPNDPNLREVATWAPLWGSLLATAGDADHALYCHSKGATRQVDPGNSCHWWASLCWSLVLDHWPLIEAKLAHRPICGPFKKVGYGFGHGFGRWHYSGTFYWVRVGDFRRRWPRVEVPRQWWGTEAWPGLAYDIAEGESIFMDGQVPGLDLYRPSFWAGAIRPNYERWIGENKPSWDFAREPSLAAGG